MNTVPLSVLLDVLAAMEFAMHDEATSAKSFYELSQARAPLKVRVDEIMERQQVEITA